MYDEGGLGFEADAEPEPVRSDRAAPRTNYVLHLLEHRFKTVLVVGAVLIIFIVLLIER